MFNTSIIWFHVKYQFHIKFHLNIILSHCRNRENILNQAWKAGFIFFILVLHFHFLHFQNLNTFASRSRISSIPQSNLNKKFCFILIYFYYFTYFPCQYTNIQLGVMSGFLFTPDQSAMNLVLKTKYTPRAVVRLINIFNCLTVKEE